MDDELIDDSTGLRVMLYDDLLFEDDELLRPTESELGSKLVSLPRARVSLGVSK